MQKTPNGRVEKSDPDHSNAQKLKPPRNQFNTPNNCGRFHRALRWRSENFSMKQNRKKQKQSQKNRDGSYHKYERAAFAVMCRFDAFHQPTVLDKAEDH